MGRKRIYISGPITKGDKNHNLHQSHVLEQALLEAGFAVYNPMPSMVRPFNGALDHKAWLEQDFAWVEVSDGVVRLPGESIGGDMETEYAGDCGVPVFYIDSVQPEVIEVAIAGLYEWFGIAPPEKVAN